MCVDIERDGVVMYWLGGSSSCRTSELRYCRGGLESLFERVLESTPKPIWIEYLLESVLPREMGVIGERRWVYLLV